MAWVWLRKYNLLTTVMVLTLLTVCTSVLLMFAATLVTDVLRPELGYFMAVLCPLVITPPLGFYFLSLMRRLEERERDLAEANRQLQAALSQVKELSGLLPICSVCKKIRDDEGYWEVLESYITKHSKAEFTHSLCPDCAQDIFDGFKQTNTDTPSA